MVRSTLCFDGHYFFWSALLIPVAVAVTKDRVFDRGPVDYSVFGCGSLFCRTSAANKQSFLPRKTRKAAFLMKHSV